METPTTDPFVALHRLQNLAADTMVCTTDMMQFFEYERLNTLPINVGRLTLSVDNMAQRVLNLNHIDAYSDIFEGFQALCNEYDQIVTDYHLEYSDIVNDLSQEAKEKLLKLWLNITKGIRKQLLPALYPESFA